MLEIMGYSPTENGMRWQGLLTRLEPSLLKNRVGSNAIGSFQTSGFICTAHLFLSTIVFFGMKYSPKNVSSPALESLIIGLV